MKKNKKITLGALSLATMLTLTGCKEQNFNDTKVFEFALDQLGDINIKKLIQEEINKVEIDRETYECFITKETIEIYYHDGNTLFINGLNGIENFKEVSDVVYEQINLLIQEEKVNTIKFSNLTNQIDFAKLNLSNVKELQFDTFKGTFDSTKVDVSNIKLLSFANCEGTFDFSGFSNQITNFYFSNVSLEFAKEVISNFDLKDSSLVWRENKENNDNLKPFLECLLENNIDIEQLSLHDYNKANGITKEEFDLLSKLNARFLYIYADGFKEPLNLDLTLNEKIQGLYIDAYKNFHDRINGELGSINIKSNNEELDLYFSYADITNNTHFSLPDSTWISLSQLNCTDISAFNDLRNVSYLWFKESVGPGPEGDLRGEIRYCKNTEYFSQVKSCYRNYEDVLRDIEYFWKLSKLKEKLNVSPYEETRYYNTPSIGDYVNLVSDDVFISKDIYSLETQEDLITSYYGTSILHCISSVEMSKEDEKIKVDNMNDYEFYISEGYKVIGYEFVNLYSLNEDDTLTTEFFCKEEDMKLVFTPFK